MAERTLAIDCASEACSVALFQGDDLVASEYRVLGRGHAEHLVPMIADLPDRGLADRVLVARGPGSFTGVRIGIAAARALGVAWGIPVSGYPTLALVAAMARSEVGDQSITVCTTGGHGDWFVQDFGSDGMPSGELQSRPSASAAKGRVCDVVAGSQAEALAAAVKAVHGRAPRALPLLPDARHARALPAALVTDDVSPLYGRAPDARLPA